MHAWSEWGECTLSGKPRERRKTKTDGTMHDALLFCTVTGGRRGSWEEMYSPKQNKKKKDEMRVNAVDPIKYATKQPTNSSGYH